MIYKKILSAVCVCALLTGCGTMDENTAETTNPATTTTTTGTTISALTTPTTSTTTNTTLASANTETTTDYTIPSMPEITITTSTSAAETTESAASSASQGASTTSKAAESTIHTAVTIGKAFTMEAETITVDAGAKSVPFNINIYNNPGFSSASYVVSYGNLLPVGESTEAKFDCNAKLESALQTCMFNNKTQLLAYALMDKKDFTENGMFCTFYFDLPADAKSGMEYPVNLTVNAIGNEAGKSINAETVSGKIIVK